MFPRDYCKLLLGGLLSLGLANLANADNRTLLAGNSACTQDVQSTGLYFIGGAPAKMTWTVWASSTANGAATQIFETVEQLSRTPLIMMSNRQSPEHTSSTRVSIIPRQKSGITTLR